MNKVSFRNLVLAAAACVVMAVPAMSSAQRWPVDNQQNQGRWNQSRWNDNQSLKQQVDRAERESNRFRDDFEKQYRGRDRGRNWNRQNDYGFWGSDLKSDIQKMDEAFERLRHAVDRYNSRSSNSGRYGNNDRYDNNGRRDNNGRYGSNFGNNDARREMENIMRYAREIDRELGRGFGNYRTNGRSLTSQWRSLYDDIKELGREFNVRS